VQGGALRETILQGLQDSFSQTREEEDSAIIEEAPEPLDPQERAVRRAKNIRYNAGGRDLTTPGPGIETFIEHVWPRVEFMPTSKSVVVVTGRVVKLQPYLSEDRSRIYTEIAIQVDDVLKGKVNNMLSAANTLVIDRLGGVLKLRTGRIVRDDIHIKGLGKTRIGKRYTFFAGRVGKESDISLIKSYELRDGRVYTNDSRVSRLISVMPGVPEAWTYEATFLEAVRQEVRKEVSQPNNKKIRERRQ
jgi:hypothetical protein